MSKSESARRDPAERGRILQLVLSLILFAGFAILLFVPNTAYYDNTFLELLLQILKGSFIGNAALKAALFVIVIAYAVLLVCTVAAFFCRRVAALAFNALKTLILLAAFAFFAIALIGNYGLNVIDIFYSKNTILAINSLSLAILFGLLALAVLSFTAHRAYAVVKVLFVCFSVSFFFLERQAFVENYSLFDLFGSLQLADSALGTATRIVFQVLAWATLVNFGLAVLTLVLPRNNPLDTLRADVLFVIALAALALLGAYAGFSDLLGFPGTIGFGILALAQLLFAHAFALLEHFRRKRAAMQAVPAPTEEPSSEEETHLPDPAMQASIDELLQTERRALRLQAERGYADAPIADTFYDSLTPAEREEFDRLFVRMPDENGLPPYRVGGDNRDFFRKAFIYLGKFRDEISDGLLRKLYDYSERL